MADPDFYINEAESSDAIAEHGRLKARIAAAEEGVVHAQRRARGRNAQAAGTGVTMLNIVLVEPEIPQNTGNIARTCACIGARLHVVEPAGFRITERNLRRAGCDYWNDVEIVRWACAEEFFEAHAADELHLSRAM